MSYDPNKPKAHPTRPKPNNLVQIMHEMGRRFTTKSVSTTPADESSFFSSKIQKGCRLYLMIGLLKTHLDMISNSMCFSFTKLREAIFSIVFNKLNTTQMNLPLYFAAKSVVCDVRKSCFSIVILKNFFQENI